MTIRAHEAPAGTPCWRVAAWVFLAAAGLGCGATSSNAQTLNALGVSGGLAIPDAYTLGSGTLALGLSDAREPQLGPAQKPRSGLLGVGVLPWLDLVGRVAEYGERDPRGFALRLPQDLSMGVKLGVPLGSGPDALHVAAGILDLGGEAAWFRAGYAVATLPLGRFGPLGPATATLGVGRNTGRIRVPGSNGALEGAFGGISARVLDLPRYGSVSASAEYDGRQALAGVRVVSAPLPGLAQATFNASLMQTAARGPMPAALTWAVGVNLPFGDNERALPNWQPAEPKAHPASAAPQGAMPALAQLKARLRELGLESVRVGRLADGGWAVEFQNRRFGANEVDALGAVAGAAASLAPEGVRTLVLVALKLGQPVLTLETDAPTWRAFLQDGYPTTVRNATRVYRGGTLAATEVDWLQDARSAATRVQLQLSPELNYAIATEFGVFDYSLAARVRATAPLPLPWAGAQLVATVQQRVSNSPNAAPGGIYPALLHEEGLQALAVHQTLWIRRLAVLGAAVGRFEYGAFGAEAEAVVFVPGRHDVVRLRGRLLDRTPTMPPAFERAGSAIYRWAYAPDAWAEFGWQQFTDGARGTSLSAMRWWGDVGVSLNYRRGGSAHFAGLTVHFPLTPRAGLRNNERVHIEGRPMHRQSVRTRILNDANWVTPRAVRDVELAWDIDSQALNAGRLGPDYVLAQLPRMRQAFFLYAEDLRP